MTEALIRDRLGPNVNKFAFRLGGVDRVAWFAPIPEAAAQESIAADIAIRAANVRFFAGTGQFGKVLWAIAGLPALDVIEFAKVGTHNGAPDEWRVVREFVSSALVGLDFDVVYADEAGLDLRLVTEVSSEVARGIDRTLLDRLERGDRLQDSYCFMLDRAADLGLVPDPGADPRGGGRIPSFIKATRSLRLWWD